MLVGLARILVWTAREKGHLWSCYKCPALLFQMLKKLHLEPKPAQCPGAVAAGGLRSALTHYPRGLMRGQWHSGLPKQLLFCSNFTLSYSGNGSLLGGRQGYGTLQFFIPRVSVVQQTLCRAHSASSLGQCNTMIQGQQALRGEAKKLWLLREN